MGEIHLRFAILKKEALSSEMTKLYDFSFNNLPVCCEAFRVEPTVLGCPDII